MRWLTMIAVCSLATVATAAGTEWSSRPSAPGFVVGFDKSDAAQAIVERVPEGESVERWTRMLTSQRFVGRGQDPGPRQLLVNMTALMAETCPGSRVSEIVPLTVSGRAAARMRSDCPRNSQTGLPETYFVVAFAGTDDLFVEQVAFRRVPTAADVAFAMRDLQQVRWCTAASADQACARRPD